MLSVINQLGTKAFCESEITLGKINFNRLAKTSDTIHEITFARLIGLQSATF